MSAPAAAKPPRPKGWPRARGPHYLEVLGHLHQALAPEWYLEIGIGRGNSLRQARCNCVAIDPAPRICDDLGAGKKTLHICKQTSDEFFASEATQIAPGFDLVFIDGLHLFENVLRDFIGAERLCRKGAFILLHDLVPYSPEAARREWDTDVTKGWSGDVWKILPILREYRPDLEITVLDPRPSGLGIVSGLDPESTVLQDAYAAIVERYMDVTIEEFGVQTRAELLQMVPVSEALPMFNPKGQVQ